MGIRSVVIMSALAIVGIACLDKSQAPSLPKNVDSLDWASRDRIACVTARDLAEERISEQEALAIMEDLAQNENWRTAIKSQVNHYQSSVGEPQLNDSDPSYLMEWLRQHGVTHK